MCPQGCRRSPLAVEASHQVSTSMPRGRPIKTGSGNRRGLSLGLACIAIEPKPEEGVRAEGDEVGEAPDPWEGLIAEHLDRDRPLVGPKVKFGGLCEAREVIDDQDRLVA